jgi:hypothetical protein
MKKQNTEQVNILQKISIFKFSFFSFNFRSEIYTQLLYIYDMINKTTLWIENKESEK